MNVISQEELSCLLSNGVSAPSVYNSQPWLFKVHDNGLEICPDYKRCIKTADPENRGLFISMGCVAENIIQAAQEKNYCGNITISSEASLIISFDRQKNGADAFMPLFQGIEDNISNGKLWSFIKKRGSVRGAFNGRPLDYKSLSLLQNILFESGVKCYLWDKEEEQFDIFCKFLCRANAELMADKKFITELTGFLRLNKKDDQKCRDGLSYRALGLPPLPGFLGRWIVGRMVNAESQNKREQKNLHSASHLAVFSSAGNDVADLVNLGRSVERFLLHLTALGIGWSFFGSACATEALGRNLAAELALAPPEQVGAALRLGYGKSAAPSLRRSPRLI